MYSQLFSQKNTKKTKNSLRVENFLHIHTDQSVESPSPCNLFNYSNLPLLLFIQQPQPTCCVIAFAKTEGRRVPYQQRQRTESAILHYW